MALAAIWKTVRKKLLGPVLRPTLLLCDYLLGAVTLVVSAIVLLLSLPWLVWMRRRWHRECCGQRHLLVLNDFTFASVEELGIEQLTPLRCSALDRITFLIPSSADSGTLADGEDFLLDVWPEPTWYRILCACRLRAVGRVLLELSVFFRLVRLVVEKRVGIVRAFQHHYPAFRGACVSWMLNAPLLIDICGNYDMLTRWCGVTYYFSRLSQLPGFRTLARWWDRRIMGWPLKHCAHMIGRNKNNYEHGFALGASVERSSMIRISNWGRQYMDHDPQNPPECPLDKPYILLVGRLEWEKFPDDIITVFERVARDYPDLHLVLVGGGTMLDQVKARAATSFVADRIVLTGSLSIAETYRWTAHATIGWMPFAGATLTEAFLCEVPVLAYDVEWQGELVMDGYTGLLCQFRDLTHTEERIRWMLKHPEETHVMARRARELAKAVFDQDMLRECEADLYRRILAGKCGWYRDDQRLKPAY